MNLFELNEQYQQLADRDDLDPTVLVDTLDSINDAWNDKLNNIAKWCESLDSDIDFLTKKKRSISDELTYRKNLRSNLMTYMTEAIDERGLKEVHTEEFILKPRSYRQSTVIDHEITNNERSSMTRARFHLNTVTTRSTKECLMLTRQQSTRR